MHCHNIFGKSYRFSNDISRSYLLGRGQKQRFFVFQDKTFWWQKLYEPWLKKVLRFCLVSIFFRFFAHLYPLTHAWASGWDDIERWRLLTLVFGGFEPEKFKLVNQKHVRGWCRVEVYYFPFGVQRAFCPHAHSFGRFNISNSVGINSVCLFTRVSQDLKRRTGRSIRYPAFLFVWSVLIVILVRVWVFDGKNTEVNERLAQNT